ncbi:MAG: hypothetical protein Q4B08_08405 [Propionibacteriaceae bacterium]|nr:hypothetical protein [Propionibacteriaceae bacterium]
MTTILRVAHSMGMDEMLALSTGEHTAATILGNTDQMLPERGLSCRQVSAARLPNAARTLGRLHFHQEIRISDDAQVAHSVLTDGRVRGAIKSYLIRATDGSEIDACLKDLDLDLFDRLLVTSTITENYLRRRHSPPIPVELVRFVAGSPQAPLPRGPISGLTWIGSAHPSEGLQDFLRIVSLTDLPAQILWAAPPAPEQFTSVVAAMSLLGIAGRVRFGWPGPFHSFLSATQSAMDNTLWVYTARSYAPRSAIELILHLGGRVVSFDSLYAMELADQFPDHITLTPEGSAPDAAAAIRALAEEEVQ